ERGHAVIGAAPLVPEHDPSVLFTTAGMHPLIPFFLGEHHPAGRRLVNVQPCLRTVDILEVGDEGHLTFFEMCGNWSLGDYWKRQSISWSLEFLTEILGIDPARLMITCFIGDGDAPRDDEAAEAWRALGISRIAFLPKDDNWWGPPGATGPCGPDTEIFFDLEPGGPSEQTPDTHPARFREIWNNVFIQYDKQSNGLFTRLAQQNVDTGLGLERILTVLNDTPSVYETDLFVPLIEAVRNLASKPGALAERVVADHTRAAVFVLAEGVMPGNTDQPYVVRRLIRRAVRYGRELGVEGTFLPHLAGTVIDTLGDVYPHIERERETICAALEEEEGRFRRTLVRGERFFTQAADEATARGETTLSGQAAFRLYDTYGFPIELTEEEAQRRGLQVDMPGFKAAFAHHQEQSRAGAVARFRGGLGERNPATTRLHTATHLLQAALRQVLGPHVEQRGSNITSERLRFDFAHGARMTPEQIAEVEALVNRQIEADLPVTWREMEMQEARESGAIGLFGERYGERVKVYDIGDVSREICGGPHVEHTGELGHFRILKEEAVGAGVRRIKAVVTGEND
ncbi:MAG TPA: alanine--tRNA ligase, partial [Roseiflexaceae bacterium]|nr:alanine--tRNA ligase [Roseiflexaceae bacterium]